MHLREFFAKVFADVAAKTIAAIVLAIGALIVAAIAWRALLTWIAADAVMPRWVFAGVFLGALIVGCLLKFGFVLKRFRAQARKEMLETLAKERQAAAQVEPLREPTEVDPTFTLDGDRLQILLALQQAHPVELDLAQAHKATKSCPTQFHTERQLEIMRDAGVVRERRVNENAAYYRLTRVGGEYSIRYGDSARKLLASGVGSQEKTASGKPWPDLAEVSPNKFKPSADQFKMLLFLVKNYPATMTVGEAHGAAKSYTRAHTQRELNGLLDVGIIALDSDSYESVYVLTKDGLEYSTHLVDRMKVAVEAGEGSGGDRS